MSERDIMKENGVLDRLYRQEPEKYVRWGEFDMPNLNRALFGAFSWSSYAEAKGSEASRAQNKQKLWMRSTIPWKLDCDRDIMHRETAIDVFNLDLEHLGFIDYVMYLSIIIVVLMLLPFLVFCCDCTGRRAYIFSTVEPFITRVLFAGIFISMLKIIQVEKE